jgi:hypothetical protein
MHSGVRVRRAIFGTALLAGAMALNGCYKETERSGSPQAQSSAAAALPQSKTQEDAPLPPLNKAAATDDSDTTEALGKYGEFAYSESGFKATLATFKQWAKANDGLARFKISDSGGHPIIMVQMFWTYEDKTQADYGFVFLPGDSSRELSLIHAYRGKGELTNKEAKEVIDGIVLDMYHRGWAEPIE